eukprot:JP442673.1.p1 GENE.JP442673.1~~JP442673.1.p1  ORF type:complete len:60 (-),score=2.50 JP442673.1:36-215(-)
MWPNGRCWWQLNSCMFFGHTVELLACLRYYLAVGVLADGLSTLQHFKFHAEPTLARPAP